MARAGCAVAGCELEEEASGLSVSGGAVLLARVLACGSDGALAAVRIGTHGLACVDAVLRRGWALSFRVMRDLVLALHPKQLPALSAKLLAPRREISK